eukprot:331925-Chlamydomonas_euryale.AAC.1
MWSSTCDNGVLVPATPVSAVARCERLNEDVRSQATCEDAATRAQGTQHLKVWTASVDARPVPSAMLCTQRATSRTHNLRVWTASVDARPVPSAMLRTQQATSRTHNTHTEVETAMHLPPLPPHTEDEIGSIFPLT